MTDVSELLAMAREAYHDRQWSAARTNFLAARQVAELSADDLDALGGTSWWIGDIEVCNSAWEAAYRAYLDDDRPAAAAETALGIGYNYFLRGEEAPGMGWLGRAQRLLADLPESRAHGGLLYTTQVEAMIDSPDPDAVIASARLVQEMGARLAEPALVASGLQGEGRVLIKNGRVMEGLALLDEAMVSVLADELPPEMAGNIYCNVIAACHELADYRRMRQWTEATERWLATMPVAVVFAGICRVHRAQLQQLTGDWDSSAREAAQVCVDLADMLTATAAEGHYQVGEINRLRGDLTAAEEAYQRAHRLGRDPQPGLALLRVAQQRAAAALSSIQSALMAQPTNRLARARLLAAQVGIALAADDTATARKGSAELDEIAAAFASAGLRAAAEHARGTLLLAEGHVAEAVPVLMAACRAWQEIGAPYECAKVRVLLAAAYQQLADVDSAELELAAAADAFAELGATPDAAIIAGMRRPTARPGGLTDREVEVLACVAAGRSNKEIAAELVISGKTVQRHLANIFTKLDLNSRTAAAAYAFEHGLVPSPRG